MLSTDFRAKLTDADKYLSLLGWVSVRHSEEFAEFIRRQSGRRRFLGLTREEVVETCRHCQAREIASTPY